LKSARSASLAGTVSTGKRQHFVRSEQVNAAPLVSRRGISGQQKIDASESVAARISRTDLDAGTPGCSLLDGNAVRFPGNLDGSERAAPIPQSGGSSGTRLAFPPVESRFVASPEECSASRPVA